MFCASHRCSVLQALFEYPFGRNRISLSPASAARPLVGPAAFAGDADSNIGIFNEQPFDLSMSINNEGVFCLSRGFAVPRFGLKAALVLSVWWRMTGSNRRPPACKAGALPAELIPRACLLSCSGVCPLVGLVGLEPTTPALSRRCSDQLSYRPRRLAPTRSNNRLVWAFDFVCCFCLLSFSRKEVIQPHLPIRLPCYDFTPVTNPAVVVALLAVRLTTSGRTRSHGVTGGVYKTRERIHRGVLIRDYYRFRLHAVELQTAIRTTTGFLGLAPPRGLACPLYRPLYDVCSPTYKGHEDLTSSPPSSGLSPAVSSECPTQCGN